MRIESTVWEHPQYGEVFVFWSWKEFGGYGWWTPIGVEFDIFVPPEEQAALIEGLYAEVDRVRSARPPTPPVIPDGSRPGLPS
jgi:hypothetical protein